MKTMGYFRLKFQKKLCLGGGAYNFHEAGGACSRLKVKAQYTRTHTHALYTYTHTHTHSHSHSHAVTHTHALRSPQHSTVCLRWRRTKRRSPTGLSAPSSVSCYQVSCSAIQCRAVWCSAGQGSVV